MSTFTGAFAEWVESRSESLYASEPESLAEARDSIAHGDHRIVAMDMARQMLTSGPLTPEDAAYLLRFAERGFLGKSSPYVVETLKAATPAA